MIRLQDILDQVEANHPGADTDLIRKAYDFSARVHDGQVRRSGEPSLNHPLEVSFILAQLKLDTPTIVTGLLHDVLQKDPATTTELEQTFGSEVAEMVEGVTKLGKMEFRTSERRQAENFRKMLLALARDIRVILVKLADRLHNMRTLDALPEERQREVAQETREIFAPLANRLGISWIKNEFETLAFRYQQPEVFAELAGKVERRHREREKSIARIQRDLQELLQRNALQGQISGRIKHLYSLHKKMVNQGISFDEVHDLIAFRIIVDSVKDCYAVLGIVHATWTPIPGRFKDYIAMPKANMYQSLHTTVMGRDGGRMEVQIRTAEMHRIAEEGIAAHWKYKEGGSVTASGQSDNQFRWLRQMLDWQQDLQDSKEFLSAVKVDLFPEEVYVFTPGGDVKELPQGATTIDFAFAVHSDVGLHCSGAKVNSKMVPLRTELKNGDIVEVITSKQQTPSKDWLKFVRTSKARNKIRNWVKTEQRDRSIELGRDLLEKKLRRSGASLKKTLVSKGFLEACSELGFKQTDEVLAAIGYGKLSAGQVVSRALPREKLQKNPIPATGFGKVIEKLRPKPSGAIRIDGVEDILVRFAKCCNPLPGDPVVGFITRGRGVTVHTNDCSYMHESDPERRVDVTWDRRQTVARRVSIRVNCANVKGMLANLTTAITNCEANIVSAKVLSTPREQGVNTFEVEVTDLDHLTQVLNALRKIKGVHDVERLRH